MPDCDLTNPAFTDEDEARKVIEATLWPNGVVCPHCGLPVRQAAWRQIDGAGLVSLQSMP